MGVERTPNMTKVNPGEENSPAAPAGIRTGNLSITSPALLPTNYPGSPSTRKSKLHTLSLCRTDNMLNYLYLVFRRIADSALI